jgi:NADH dehydrogenase FAD-containing subunit
MVHRIVVLGAGYAGVPAVRRLANRTDPQSVRIVVVNASDRFLERPCLRQAATGQIQVQIDLHQLFAAPTRFVTGQGVGLDPHARRVTVATVDRSAVRPADADPRQDAVADTVLRTTECNTQARAGGTQPPYQGQTNSQVQGHHWAGRAP